MASEKELLECGHWALNWSNDEGKCIACDVERDPYPSEEGDDHAE